MKSDAPFQFHNKFTLFKPVASQDESGDTTVTYEKVGDMVGYVVLSHSSMYVTTREVLQPLSAMDNLVDRNGTPYSFHNRLYVIKSSPEVDYTGAIVAYKHTVSHELPRNFIKEIGEFLVSANNQ